MVVNKAKWCDNISFQWREEWREKGNIWKFEMALKRGQEEEISEGMR